MSVAMTGTGSMPLGHQTATREAHMQSIDQFVSRLKRRQLFGSNQTAVETAHLLRTVISTARWPNAADLLRILREIGIRLVKAQPIEFAVGNVVRRVMHLVREEYRASTLAVRDGPLPVTGSESFESAGSIASLKSSNSIRLPTAESAMYNLLAEPASTHPDYSRPCFSLKQAVIQSVNELIDDLETASSGLAQQALEHIHAHELIMTFGRSRSVESFLLEAARVRSFRVVVVEGAPKYGGHQLARTLAAANIETLLVPDAAVMAMMPRVSKVVVGCHAVTADAGLVAPSGTLLLADAASLHAVPVCVIAGLYKFSPIYPEHDDTLNLFANPDPVLPFSEGDLIEKVDVINPSFDSIPSQLISLFITNMGGRPPSYVYRLLSELYDLEDYILE